MFADDFFAIKEYIGNFAVELRCNCLFQGQLIIGNPVRIRDCTRSCNFRMFQWLSWPLSMMMGRRRWRNKSEDLPQFFNLRISGKDFRRTVFLMQLDFHLGRYRLCTLVYLLLLLEWYRHLCRYLDYYRFL